MKIRAGSSPKSEGGVTGWSKGKEEEDGILLGKRLKPPDENQGAGESQRRAREVRTEKVEGPQEGTGVERGRKLPSFEGRR